MRDYALNRAIASEDYGFSLARLWRNWKSRRQLARLYKCHDYLLRDMGIERADVDWALRLSLRDNPLLALEDRAWCNRRHLILR
jgi:uncharacterized protein YjiS (DUF1127 family)